MRRWALRVCARSLATSEAPIKPYAPSAATPTFRRLLPLKKRIPSKRSSAPDQNSSRRVSAHLMASTHEQRELASALRARFGAGAVQVFEAPSSPGFAGESSTIDGVVHLSAPASGTDAPHGSPPASAFFFTGKDVDGLSSSACVSVWWGAEPSFEDALLRDLQALRSGTVLSRQQQLDRLAVPRTVMKWQPDERSELGRDEILIDSTCDTRSRVLDQLSFSHALQRHMKLVLLEDEMERILSSVKRFVRQGRPSLFLRFLPTALGGVDSGALTMQVRIIAMHQHSLPSALHTPVPLRACVRAPDTDGAVLPASRCSGCY